MLLQHFPSIFLAGYECSTHRRWDHERLDLIAATQHDRYCERDYALAVRHGIRAARDGFRWHLIETEPGRYDWSSVRPMIQAARRQGVRVIWDLCHYGYPDDLDIWSDEFLERFSAFCYAATKLISEESEQPPAVCPVNEISFWAWLGGLEGRMNPHARGHPAELKRQLVRAALVGIDAARAADRETVIICAEPLINIVTDSHHEADLAAANHYHEAQYESIDMLLGRRDAELGGHPGALDIVGVNYYTHNQWRLRGGFVPLGHCEYRPLSELLHEVHQRYGKPVLITETGAEHSARPMWVSYVSHEVRVALEIGVPVTGICLYPITDYKGWENDRICQVGLFCAGDSEGQRTVYRPLARELSHQAELFAEAGWHPERQAPGLREAG